MRHRNKPISEHAIGGIALALTTICGSTYNVFAKPLTDVLSPLSLLFVSEVLTLFFVIASFGALPTIKAALKMKRKHYLPLLAVGLLSSIIGPMLWFTGLHLTSAVNASLIGKNDLVIMLVLAYFLLGERFTKRHVMALGIVITGLVLVSLRGFTLGFQPQWSDMIIILSMLSFGLGSILFRKYLTHVEAHVALFIRSLIAISAFFIVSPFIETPFIAELHAFPVTLLPALVGFGFISRFLNTFMYYQAIERLPIITVSLTLTLDTILGTFFAFWFLGETIAWYHLAGGACIIAGNVVLEFVGTHNNPADKELHMKQRVAHQP